VAHDQQRLSEGTSHSPADFRIVFPQLLAQLTEWRTGKRLGRAAESHDFHLQRSPPPFPHCVAVNGAGRLGKVISEWTKSANHGVSLEFSSAFSMVHGLHTKCRLTGGV